MKNNARCLHSLTALRCLVTFRRLAACLALLILPACATATAKLSTTAALVVVVPGGSIARTLEEAAASFTQVDGAQVRVEAFGSEDYAARVTAALLAGKDRYDLVYLDADNLARWAAYHAILPLTGDFETQAMKPWLAAVSYAGKLYGLPTQPDPVGLWYRADLLKTAGQPVPADWDILLQVARTLDKLPGTQGIAITGSDVDACADFAAVLAGFGGEMVSTQYRVEMDGESARQALKFYAALATPGAERMTGAGVLAALRDGHAAMGIAPLSAGTTLLDCKTSPRVCKEGQPLLAWTRLPGFEEQLAVGSLGAWAVPIHAAHSDLAQRFTVWLGSEVGAGAWARAGGIPAHTSVLAGPQGMRSLGRVADYRLAFPPVSTTDLLWKACNSAVHAAVAGKAAGAASEDQVQALDGAADQMRQALRQAGIKSEE